MIKREDMQGMARWIRDTIVTRTRAGIGADGRKLAPLDTGKPSTLTKSGRMLDTLRITIDDDGVTITPTVDYARYVSQERPFLGLTDGELPDLDREMERALDAAEARYERERRR